MILKNRSVKKALPYLTIVFFLFSMLMVYSFFTLNQSSYFHQLNIRHFKYTDELNSLISVPNKLLQTNQNVNIADVRSAIINIRQQPIECLANINQSERIIMRWVGTESIVDICKNDIVMANKTLNFIEVYEAGNITKEVLQGQLVEALEAFRKNSIDFEAPVEKTLRSIASMTIGLIILSSFCVICFAIYLSRAVSIVLTKREEAMIALAKSETLNKEMAYTDSLTGLPNRNLLQGTIDKSIAKAVRGRSQFAVMFIDLDQFKDINDTLGHTVGDQLLIEMANRISHTLRDNDTIVRFGGDEFVAVTDNFDSIETIDPIAHRIIDAVNVPIQLGEREVLITASIGIACYPHNGSDTTSLLKHADAAMYQAKNAGKNQFQPYDQQSASKQNRKLNLANLLHSAIANNELSLVYQPVVRLSDGCTVGSEALLRWTTASGEKIGPDEFIPIAEHSGQIIEIGDWVIEQACLQCKAWHKEGAVDHIMAINVSSQQLKDTSFAKRLADTLRSYNLPAKCVHIEITENIAITEDQTCIATLHELAKLGTKLLLDDFGTGYSCLSYLKDLPFDVLKIDKSFMPANNTIASTIIAMGHELNMEIIAEGIERPECYRYLKNLDCHYGQGYLFQKPVPADEFDVFKQFKNHEPDPSLCY
ncbi:putative bifunctional diguanylate cyclase/phosphodiesterase [Glaciecola sp. 2405UD65-10]|uniref:putative bifunctional diguanylate cyclase/phosphodiesterase n=1 Tax=Glaciecola sp. 2405UD65-10 TaxID=3397244 RepID=UPI003B5A68F4